MAKSSSSAKKTNRLNPALSPGSEEHKGFITASAIVAFNQCPHITTLELQKTPKGDRTAFEKMISDSGTTFEKSLVDQMKPDVCIPRDTDKKQRASLTIDAIKKGAQLIYAAYFYDEELGLEGEADFLQRVENPNTPWGYGYEVLDAKVSIKIKAKYPIQLCHYSVLLARIQGYTPLQAYIINGKGEWHPFKLSEYLSYYGVLLENYRNFLEHPLPTEPYPIEHCKYCAYRDHCSQHLLQLNHISMTAGIRRSQAQALMKDGINTVAKLSEVQQPLPKKLRGLGESGLTQLVRQAKAQTDNIPIIIDKRFLSTINDPQVGDVYFDMESYPFSEGKKLEYLFGFAVRQKEGDPLITHLWATDLDDEEEAFGDACKYLSSHLKKFPDARIYHYSHYEPTNFRKLALHYKHDIEFINGILGPFIDLYAFIRRSVAMPRENRSLKTLESVYRFERHGDIGNASDSVVLFESFLRDGDQANLNKIQKYNEEDLLSTMALHDWLSLLKRENR